MPQGLEFVSGGDLPTEGMDLHGTGDLVKPQIELLGMEGRERISGLFEFDLLLLPNYPFTEEHLKELLGSPCAIAMEADAEYPIHGVLESIQELDAEETDNRYLARMVPSAWLLSLTRGSRLYQKKDVGDLVESVLGRYGLSSGEDFQIKGVDGAPLHEYVVQYEESDLSFIERWLEREGLFYWFEHLEDKEKLVIAGANTDATGAGEPFKIPFRKRNDLSAGKNTVWDWDLTVRRTAARVAVQDYDYQHPTYRLLETADVDKKGGFGRVFYSEYFDDGDQGKRLARVRAQRLFCERKRFEGKTDSRRFRAGHTFELTGHDSQDGEYLITAVRHRMGLPVNAAKEARGRHLGTWEPYRCEFEAIPVGVPFRPERRTPWPRIDGVLHAHISQEGEGEVASLDEMGRYHVKLPFDRTAGEGEGASRWIRLAQPYSGTRYGTHFPLHKGAEVLLAHIGGDPDRPVIVGAVPNAITISPSTLENPTQSVVQTASGIRIEMEDQQK